MNRIDNATAARCKEILDENNPSTRHSALLNIGWTEVAANAVLGSSVLMNNLLAYLNQRLIVPNAEQSFLLDILCRAVHTRAAASAAGMIALQENILVLGGPGVGKTFFVKQ